MNKYLLTSLSAMALFAVVGCTTTPNTVRATASETGNADLSCKMSFSLSGWSIIYKHADGEGVVTCANGKSMPVKITVEGGGLTAGKWHVDNGTGKFSDVHRISDVLGDYAQGGAHAGAIKSASAQVLTKGTVSLALAGTGEGINLGVDAGKFTISRK